MRGFLKVMGVLGMLFAGYVFTNAKSAIHETEGLIAVLIGVVALGLEGVIGAIERSGQPHAAAATSGHVLPRQSMADAIAEHERQRAAYGVAEPTVTTARPEWQRGDRPPTEP